MVEYFQKTRRQLVSANKNEDYIGEDCPMLTMRTEERTLAHLHQILFSFYRSVAHHE